jgi:hypothetical protein
MSIHKKLLEVQKGMPRIDKDSTNPHFKNKYATLANVLSVVLPELNKHGIYQTNTQSYCEAGWVITVKLVDAESGELIETMLPLLNTQDMQKMGGSITYAHRYGLLPLLGIAPEMDDDGNSVSITEKKETINVDPEVERIALCQQLDELLSQELPENERLPKIKEAAVNSYEGWTVVNLKQAIVFVKGLK